MSVEFWFTQLLNALQLSMLLFLLSVGLTVIFGLMHFVNLAHGSFYALGAYLSATASAGLGYWSGLIVAPLGVALAGTVLYLLLIRRMRRFGPMAQVLVTFGLIFALQDMTRMIWGSIPLGVDAPALLSSRINLGLVEYPTYRLFIILLGAAVGGGLFLIVSRTKIGAAIRASVDNDAMAACLGINVERLFFFVFCFGCALAGLAGAAAAPVLSVTPEMGLEILIPVLIVVVLGGLGSLKGAVIGSLVIGFVQTFGAVLMPTVSSLLVYALLALTLLMRPEGLFPAKV